MQNAIISQAIFVVCILSDFPSEILECFIEYYPLFSMQYTHRSSLMFVIYAPNLSNVLRISRNMKKSIRKSIMLSTNTRKLSQLLIPLVSTVINLCPLLNQNKHPHLLWKSRPGRHS